MIDLKVIDYRLKRVVTSGAGRCGLVVVLGLMIAAGSTANSSSSKLPGRWVGLWSLHTDLGAPGITALTDEEAKALLGQKIRIAQNRVQMGSEVCASPTFRVSSQTTAEFLSDYRVSQAQFPLFGTKVEILDIKCRQSVTYRFGRLENGCTLIAREGHFFEIIKYADSMRTTAQSMPQCLEKRSKGH